MINRRRLAALLAASTAAATASRTGAVEPVRVIESLPAASAVVGRRGTNFFIRFDKPVDHERSRLMILRDDRVIEVLVPRLEAQPDVLFARATTLPDGDYVLRWEVRTLAGVEVQQGDIPFVVKE